jgi:hypothetical protein
VQFERLPNFGLGRRVPACDVNILKYLLNVRVYIGIDM